MSQWNQYRLVDVFSHIDAAVMENDCLEEDLKNMRKIGNLKMYVDDKKKPSRKKLKLVTGIAIGSVALTGAVVTVCRKNILAKRAV